MRTFSGWMFLLVLTACQEDNPTRGLVQPDDAAAQGSDALAADAQGVRDAGKEAEEDQGFQLVTNDGGSSQGEDADSLVPDAQVADATVELTDVGSDRDAGSHRDALPDHDALSDRDAMSDQDARSSPDAIVPADDASSDHLDAEPQDDVPNQLVLTDTIVSVEAAQRPFAMVLQVATYTRAEDVGRQWEEVETVVNNERVSIILPSREYPSNALCGIRVSVTFYTDPGDVSGTDIIGAPNQRLCEMRGDVPTIDPTLAQVRIDIGEQVFDLTDFDAFPEGRFCSALLILREEGVCSL